MRTGWCTARTAPVPPRQSRLARRQVMFGQLFFGMSALHPHAASGCEEHPTCVDVRRWLAYKMRVSCGGEGKVSSQHTPLNSRCGTGVASDYILAASDTMIKLGYVSLAFFASLAQAVVPEWGQVRFCDTRLVRWEVRLLTVPHSAAGSAGRETPHVLPG